MQVHYFSLALHKNNHVHPQIPPPNHVHPEFPPDHVPLVSWESFFSHAITSKA